MNYLLIDGDDVKLKNEVVRLYALKLMASADFDLKQGTVSEAQGGCFQAVFYNRVTQKCVLVNSKKLSAALYDRILHFKQNYPPSDTILTTVPEQNMPDREKLMDTFDVLPDDMAIEIDVRSLAVKNPQNASEYADQVEQILSKSPFNLL